MITCKTPLVNGINIFFVIFNRASSEVSGLKCWLYHLSFVRSAKCISDSNCRQKARGHSSVLRDEPLIISQPCLRLDQPHSHPIIGPLLLILPPRCSQILLLHSPSSACKELVPSLSRLGCDDPLTGSPQLLSPPFHFPLKPESLKAPI